MRSTQEERDRRDEEILRLVRGGWSERKIAGMLEISRSTVWDVKQKARRRTGP